MKNDDGGCFDKGNINKATLSPITRLDDSQVIYDISMTSINSTTVVSLEKTAAGAFEV